jgi:beta-glucosidase
MQSMQTYKGKPITHAHDREIDRIVSEMTLEEKIGMLHGTSMFTTAGVARLGVPELKMADGPLGVREEISRDSWAPLGGDDDFATYYPSGGGVAATWNPQLAYVFGNSVGEESRARDKDVLLSPAVNIIRTPLGGRTYEYFTEDPFLNKKLTVPFIVGLQENDVAACVKHYAANNQETYRDFVDVRIDERTLREIYLPAFKAAVMEARAHSVMGAYNKFRGAYLCENSSMLNDVLRDEWGFEGVVISDWAAVHSSAHALKSGLDIEMGTPKPFNEFFLADPLMGEIKAGMISEAEIDIHIKRILRLMYTVKLMGSEERAQGSINTEAHFREAYDIASESVVLLKNSENVLPINPEEITSIAVIGNNATKKNALGGYGAGVKTKREVTPLEGIRNRLPESVAINYEEGYQERYAPKREAIFGEVTQERVETIDELDPEMLQEALDAAGKSDVVVIFAGSNRDYETEASDRPDLKLPFAQEELIEKVLEVNRNTVVVMIAGAPFEIGNIRDQASTLVWSWFNGSEGGNALADVLLGTVNPSGKLPWTMPEKLEDSPAHATHSFPGDSTVTYAEKLLVGYRWFDTKNIEPTYPFGFGLSYTSFEIVEVATDKEYYSKTDTIYLTAAVRNTGAIDGKEVVQVYAAVKDSKVDRPAQELKGFSKVLVPSGETRSVTIAIPVSELAYYNVEERNWEVEATQYELRLGNSSRDVQATLGISVQ